MDEEEEYWEVYRELRSLSREARGEKVHELLTKGYSRDTITSVLDWLDLTNLAIYRSIPAILWRNFKLCTIHLFTAIRRKLTWRHS